MKLSCYHCYRWDIYGHVPVLGLIPHHTWRLRPPPLRVRRFGGAACNAPEKLFDAKVPALQGTPTGMCIANRICGGDADR